MTKLNLAEPEIWFVRILIHKIRGKCIDIRQFEKLNDGESIRYIPTDNGIVFTLDEWPQLLDPFWKLFRKHRDTK